MEPKERQSEILRVKNSKTPFRPVEELDQILFGTTPKDEAPQEFQSCEDFAVDEV